LAIDQGTTSTRAIVFDGRMQPIASAQKEFHQHYPSPGWVEHDAEEIWETVLLTVRGAIEKAAIAPSDLAAIGITNQRETTLVWDRSTGKPIGHAIVWQDRRTSAQCERLREAGLEPLVQERTGLLVDPYFSGTKLSWMLETIPGARERAQAGKLAFGTIDSFLIWRLTGGKTHVTDATNASRTLLFDIHKQEWCEELCSIFEIPTSILPQVENCAAEFGVCEPGLFGAAIPIRGVAGDQQSAVIGQACFSPGMIKATFGTGCFALLNTGAFCVPSANKLISTVAYRLGGKVTYALEGSIFMAGATVQWLRDELGMIKSADEIGPLAAQSDPDQPVYLVPAFVGLGAPWWDPDARAAVFGMTRATGRAEFARAALESVCYQARDLVDAMHADWQSGPHQTVLRADGGMVKSDWLMQRLADVLDAPVDRPEFLETTALGAAWLAGHQAGVWPDQEGFAEGWHLQRRFQSDWDERTRTTRVGGWHDALRLALKADAVGIPSKLIA
jgi:glycerol kinase